MVKDFVYLGALTRSSIQSSQETVQIYFGAVLYGHGEYGQALLEVMKNLNISEVEIV